MKKYIVASGTALKNVARIPSANQPRLGRTVAALFIGSALLSACGGGGDPPSSTSATDGAGMALVAGSSSTVIAPQAAAGAGGAFALDPARPMASAPAPVMASSPLQSAADNAAGVPTGDPVLDEQRRRNPATPTPAPAPAPVVVSPPAVSGTPATAPVPQPAPAPAPATSPAPQPAPAPLPAECARVTAATCATWKALGRGMNLGNMLEGGTDGSYGIVLDTQIIKNISDAGFKHVRLPIRWSNHASKDASAVLDPAFLARIDGVLNDIERYGMYVVMDMHHYRQLDGDPTEWNEAWVDPSVVQARAVNIWKQLSARYRGRYAKMVYELYNEPHNALDNNAWNALHPKLLAAVRGNDASRPVMLGTTQWSNISELPSLYVPNDPNLIVTVHAYDPYPFTHQGAWGSQWTTPTSCCTADQANLVRGQLDKAAAWSRTKGYPIYVGETGVHISAPQAGRANFARLMRVELEARGLSWAWWGYGADFGVFDTNANTWNWEVMNALMGW